MKLTLVFCSAFFLTGCMNSFYSYSSRIKPTRVAFEAEQKEKSLEVPKDYIDSSDAQLYCLESAKVNQGFMDFESSRLNFKTALDEFKKDEADAKYTVSGTASQVGSLFLNDNALDYKASEYERIFAYTYQCLNYLLKGNVNVAEIYSRKALNEQRFFEQSKAASSDESSVDQSAQVFESNLASKMNGMNKAAATVSNKYENPLTYFLSGVISEVQGDYNDAAVSYKKGLKVVKGSPVFMNSLMNLESQHFPGSHTFKQIKYPDLPAGDFGEVVVILDDGLIPLKEEVLIPFPTGSGVTTVAFPIYKEDMKDSSRLFIQVGAHTFHVDPICNVYGMASKNLKDQLTYLVTKTIARVASKVAIQVAVQNQFGDIGMSLSSIWNIASERADTRGWSLLPYYVQAGRQFVAVGEYKLAIAGEPMSTIKVRKNRKTLLYVNRVGGKLSYKLINL